MAKNRLIKKILSANRLARNLGYQRFVQAARAGLQIEIIEKLAKERVLVIVPHPDDETLGCGGTLIKYCTNGSDIRLVVITRGESANPELDKKKLAETRSEEIRQVAKKLEAELSFADQTDGQVASNRLTDIIAREIIEFQPGIIFLPSEIDDHLDHRESTKAVKLVLQKINQESPKIIQQLRLHFYEVWTPLYPNRIVTIDPNEKMKLIDCYQSQLKDRDYGQAILGLNTYRGLIQGLTTPAEAFFSIPAKLWLKL